MKTCEYNGEALTLRSHPWTEAEASSAFRYHDLKASPGLIRTSLEDFVPWSHYPAVERFYTLIEWLNGKASRLETNDCEFSAPQPNQNTQIPQAFECSGRLMVLFRELARNVSQQDLRTLTHAFHNALAPLDPEFEHGIVGTTLVPVRYISLAGSLDAQLGGQLMISFWAWGGTQAETMTNLDRLIGNLARALRQVGA